jgi:hypothetical protein
VKRVKKVAEAANQEIVLKQRNVGGKSKLTQNLWKKKIRKSFLIAKNCLISKKMFKH